MTKKATNIIVAGLLIFLFLISVFSIRGDSLTMDEQAHLPTGYSYLTQQDMRLNPEHPPLVKDLAAVPLLFINDIQFPSEIPAWQADVNGQWDFGRYFLYETGNPAEQMIFWGRIPMILLLLLLAFYVFRWTRELFGDKAALLALFLFSFSPTLIAHGRLVTTDVGAAAGIFIASYYFLRTLKTPTLKNIVIAGVVLGLAQLLKFSVILLIPFFGFLALVWWLLKKNSFFQVAKITALVFIIGLIVIWPVYQYHTLNYPAERQLADAEVYLEDTFDPIKAPILWMSDKPILRPYAQYLTGVVMVFLRVSGGNTTYFLGEVSNIGWRSYFPIVYLIKVPLAFHILTLITFLYALFRIKKIKKWLKSSFPQFALLFFIILYWIVSVTGDLNIGVRHLLPVFPLTILLVAGGTIAWLKNPYLKLKYALLGFLLVWQAVSVVSIYPHFIAYFNETVGGASNGYKYVVDSNLDWGQDLKRLKTWADENNVDKVYVDYFGGSDPQYILGEKYARWWGERDPTELEKGSYLAVSVSFLQGGRGDAIATLPQASGFYRWLNSYEPVARIGYSIFVYYIK